MRSNTQRLAYLESKLSPQESKIIIEIAYKSSETKTTFFKIGKKEYQVLNGISLKELIEKTIRKSKQKIITVEIISPVYEN